MNHEAYVRTAQLTFLVCRVIEGTDFRAMVEAIQRAEALGPFVDPTLMQRYLLGGGREVNQCLEEVAAHLTEIQAIVTKYKPKIREVYERAVNGGEVPGV